MNKDMSMATFPSIQFFMDKFLTLLAKSLYLMIIAVLLTPFVCEEKDGD